MDEVAAPSRPSVHRHAIAAVALASLIGAFVGAGQASTAVMQVALSDGLLAVAWLAAMTGWGSLLSRRILRIPTEEPAGALLLATWAGLGMGGVSLVLLVLGALGRLNAVASWAVVLGGLALLALTLWQAWRNGDRRLRYHVGPATWLWVAAAPAIAVLVVAPAALPGLLWGDEPHGYDVVSYHLQVPREWYEAGRISTLPHNVFSYFPLAMETHYLLAMHLRGGPWAGMYVAQWMHGLLGLTTAIVAYGAVRPRGRPAATIAGVLTLATPWTAMLGAVAYNECGLMLLGTLAIAWALRAHASRAQQDVKPAYAAYAVAGVAAGLAYGFKMTAAAMIVAPLAVLMSASSPVIWRRPMMAAIFLAAAAAAAAPWWGRNLALTYNPVFPEATTVLPAGPFSAAQVERWEAAHTPREDQRSLAGRCRAFGQQVIGDWRYGFALIPAAALTGLIGRRDRTRRLLLFVLVVQVAIWLFATHLQGRFLITAIPLAAMLIATIPLELPRAAVALAAALAGAACSCVLIARLAAVPPVAYGAVDPAALWELQAPEVGQRLKDGSRPIALAGDAKAFWWPVPMSRLSYRTVFDVDVRPGETAIDAWTRGVPPDAIVVVDPAELRRFVATYRNLGEIPPDVLRRDAPYLVP